MSDTKVPLEPPPSYDAAAAPLLAADSTPTTSTTTPKAPLPRPPFPLDLPFLVKLKGQRVILASASPRRKQLLSHLGFPFEVLPSTFPENLSKSLSPFEYVLRTATEKCTLTYQAEIAHAARRDPALVIAADTIVVSSLGAILEKPRSEAQHIAMLKTLRSGGPHKVFTAVAVMAPLESARDPGYSLETTVEETTVKFDRDVTDELITAYVKTREGADKAGGYGLQGLGSVLVESVEGAADNVVGLPLRATLGLIERVLSHGDDLEDEFEKEGL